MKTGKVGIEKIEGYIPPEYLFIDKINIVHNPHSKDKAIILKNAVDVGWLGTWAAYKKKPYPEDAKHTSYTTQNAHYKKVITLLLSDSKSLDDEYAVTLELEPRASNMPFMRLDYNPAKISFATLSACLDQLVPGLADNIYTHGNITRLDIAVDVEGIKPWQVIMDYAKSRFRMCYLESGRADSIYVGKDNGVNQLYMYDKGKQLTIKKGAKGWDNPLTDDTPAVHKESLTRVEFRHRPQKATKFKQLFHLKNLFAPTYFGLTPQKVKGDTQFNILRDLFVLKGIRCAVKMIGYDEDKAFSEKMQKYGIPAFLDAEKLWSTLPAALTHVYPGSIAIMPLIAAT